MIQVKRGKGSEIEITDRKSTVVVRDQSINLNNQAIDQPGEYEAEGIEVVYGVGSALIVWERLQIVYVFAATAPTQFEKNQFSSCDILVFSSKIKELTKNSATALLDEYDPKILIATPETAIEAPYKDGLKLQESPTVKITAQALPAEGRDAFLLS